MPKNVIIIGAGGHSKVIADIIIKSEDKLLGFLDDYITFNEKVIGFPILGKISDITNYQNDVEFIIGIGNNFTRKSIVKKYDVRWYTAIHPTAVIAVDTVNGEGSAIMANAVINASAKIGKHCIINTGAIVEHDNRIADYVHLSPKVALGGTVTIGECTHVGIGATVLNNVNITSDCTIGAGAVVIRDIVTKGTYLGVPARRMEE